ncbi:methylenetetrahydrofolate reductase [Treponema sp.]
MQVSLEIVPRSEESLCAAADIATQFPAVQTLNIPDLLRFPLRSWEACSCLKTKAPHFDLIPHLRAIDFDTDKPFPHTACLLAAGVKRVLVVAGDPPQDMKKRVYPTNTVEFIKKLKIEMPSIEIYAAFDPYRSNIRFELDYVRAKEDAGADGFMSQPFFDLRLLEIYAEYLEGRTVFWGLSPVVSESSRDYWEARNRAIFPRSFTPSLDWNIDFGRRVLNFCQSDNFELYLMPIRLDISVYLQGLFS